MPNVFSRIAPEASIPRTQYLKDGHWYYASASNGQLNAVVQTPMRTYGTVAKAIANKEDLLSVLPAEIRISKSAASVGSITVRKDLLI